MTNDDCRLLVPVDGSRGSERAMAHALAIAAATDAGIDVLHVLDPGGRLGRLDARLDPEVLRDRGEMLVQRAEQMAAEADIDASSQIVVGRPPEMILDYADERRSDLLVMGRRGSEETGVRLLGGVTDKVLRGSDRPVLVVPPGGRPDVATVAYNRVLLPTDGSGPALAAAEPAAALATAFGGTVHAVTVVDPGPVGRFLEAGERADSLVDDLERRGRTSVAEVVKRVTEQGGTTVERSVVRGTPTDALATYVRDNQIDLVVMGSGGRSGVAQRVLGSVTDRLLRTVDVPVLVVSGVD